MKALIIIAFFIALSFLLSAIGKITDTRDAKVRIPVEDQDDLKESLKKYRDLMD